jgi:hypothetical protein
VASCLPAFELAGRRVPARCACVPACLRDGCVRLAERGLAERRFRVFEDVLAALISTCSPYRPPLQPPHFPLHFLGAAAAWPPACQQAGRPLAAFLLAAWLGACLAGWEASKASQQLLDRCTADARLCGCCALGCLPLGAWDGMENGWAKRACTGCGGRQTRTGVMQDGSGMHTD